MDVYLQLFDGLFGDSYIYIFLVVIVLFISISFLDSMRKRRRFVIEKPTAKTELVCPSCELREIRGYMEKDHVMKETDEKCKKCGQNLIVNLIYSEKKPKKG